ncbi:MAG: amidohydrolase family protein [Bacteroidetes bacterium]|nr:amidohydrolase family protein [Bacteroidota bacterium]MBU1719007.1 amidohydrolase family protein [Bacteroidota bacterium]
MSILLKNARYIDPETFKITKGDILVDNGLKGDIKQADSTDKADETLDCAGLFVTKAFAVGHHHVYSALARGMYPPKVNPKNFTEVLKYIWWTLDKCLDRESIEMSAYATAIACLKAGSAFVIDHHASPNLVEGSLDIIAQAFDKVGVSHLLCYEISDRDGSETAAAGLRETDRYLSRRQGLVGLHASFTVGNETLRKAVTLAQKHRSGIHVHVAEDVSDQEHCQQNYGKRVVERLHEAGVLNFGKTILGHCLHLGDHERKLIADSPCWVVQNTDSNLNNNVGFFNSEGLGENIMLGTDGMHSDMIRSARMSFLVGNHFDNMDYMKAWKRLTNVHRYIESNGFAGNGANNLVIFDYDSPTPVLARNFPGHFIFGLEPAHVKHVISNGKIVLKNRRCTLIDEDEILKRAQIATERLWDRMVM